MSKVRGPKDKQMMLMNRNILGRLSSSPPPLPREVEEKQNSDAVLIGGVEAEGHQQLMDKVHTMYIGKEVVERMKL